MMVYDILILKYLHVSFRGRKWEGKQNDNYLGEPEVLVVRQYQEFVECGHCTADGRSHHTPLGVNHHGLVGPHGHVPQGIAELHQKKLNR